MGPIDYSAQIAQLDTSPLTAGLQMRRQNQQIEAANEQRRAVTQLARAKFTAEQDANAEWRTALTAFSANPTARGVLELSARFPEQATALQSGFREYTGAQQRDVIGTTTSALGAVAAGNIDAARNIITQRRESLRNSGIDTTQTDAALSLATSADPAKRRQGMAFLATVLMGAIGGEETARVMRTFGLDAQGDNERADNVRQDRVAAEAERHNRVSEGQSAERVGLSRAAGARANKGRSKARAFTDAQLDALIQ